MRALHRNAFLWENNLGFLHREVAKAPKHMSISIILTYKESVLCAKGHENIFHIAHFLYFHFIFSYPRLCGRKNVWDFLSAFRIFLAFDSLARALGMVKIKHNLFINVSPTVQRVLGLCDLIDCKVKCPLGSSTHALFITLHQELIIYTHFREGLRLLHMIAL